MQLRSRTLEAFYGDMFDLHFADEWPETPQKGDILEIDDNGFQITARLVEREWVELDEPVKLSGKYRVTERVWLVADGESQVFDVWIEPVSLPHLPEKHPLAFLIEHSF